MHMDIYFVIFKGERKKTNQGKNMMLREWVFQKLVFNQTTSSMATVTAIIFVLVVDKNTLLCRPTFQL